MSVVAQISNSFLSVLKLDYFMYFVQIWATIIIILTWLMHTLIGV